jgi:DNA-binding PadR family transcriptional regulator
MLILIKHIYLNGILNFLLNKNQISMIKVLSKQIVGAFSVPIILSILKKGDSYGYEIVQWVKETTSDEITWKEASIYPVLKKLEDNGLIKSYWKIIENERPRKYYTLLSEGDKQLEYNLEELNTIQILLDKLKPSGK